MPADAPPEQPGPTPAIPRVEVPEDPFDLLDDDRRDRLVLLGLSVASLAHELRNRLSVIRGFAELARRGDPARAREMAAEIERVATATGQRLESWLDFAAARAAPRIALVDLVDDVGALARPICLQRDRRLDLVVHDAPEFLVDPTELRPALLDLMLNAIAHARSRLRLRAEPDPAGARILVEDDGPGLDASLDPMRFRPFQSKREGGTGLGLASAASALQRLGGSLRAEKSSLGGAAFVAIVPAPAPTAPAPLVSAPEGSGET